ncbi:MULTISPECIES: GTP pyrophosphokinase [Pseudomonas]|uniref:GTP pyrophosphokinase n=1 Tax=Pseudomonas TaxID=286 RepID=UPI001042E9D2|nr:MULTISPECIES: hypothetical protein [Pseudomonas]MBA6123798.1 hypothetical protein [Pseudomonas juntendi]MCF3158788.1 hypothetical protein [Pseudomonas juntendi]MCQ1992652.1 hypothetical protein [Pseudomonas sp. Eb3]MDG9890550.1 hypothetical protein [Pseudomonas juntendi]MDG9921631.1 hypothetical protein [Pseudomonas juntendi]
MIFKVFFFVWRKDGVTVRPLSRPLLTRSVDMGRKANNPAVAGKKISPSPASHADDMWAKDPSVIKQFLDARPGFEQLCTEVEYILKKKVVAASIVTSFVGSRAKTLNSFLEKLSRKSYSDPFNQLDDLAGARVVCLYNSDIPKVIDIIRNEFEIIEEIDKRQELETNKFGYIGNHFIVRLGKDNSGARYDDLRHLRCEIQVRTVAQDAWSIIQHHMVYKKESQVPSNLIRKLNGLAGLFETVDDQFEYIRMQRDIYLEGVRESKSAPDDFLENELNYDSLAEFVQWRFDEDLNTWEQPEKRVISKMVDVLNEMGISKLKDIQALLETHEKFADLAINAYKSICKEQSLDNPEEVWEPMRIAVAASAQTKWRDLFPWGNSWISAFTQADGKL